MYFSEATRLFDSSTAGWRDGMSQGSGTSRGLEFLSEAEFGRLDGKVAYTLSKTDRLFADINSGLGFPAKFDRRHILNVSAEYSLVQTRKRVLGISSFFTYQSGHRETTPAGEFSAEMIANLEPSEREFYYTGINNWQLPAYIRLDIGLFLRYGLETNHPGALNLGIYNLLNRHNAYAVTYNPETDRWQQLSFFPIMPSLSWSIDF